MLTFDVVVHTNVGIQCRQPDAFFRMESLIASERPVIHKRRPCELLSTIEAHLHRTFHNFVNLQDSVLRNELVASVLNDLPV